MAIGGLEALARGKGPLAGAKGGGIAEGSEKVGKDRNSR